MQVYECAIVLVNPADVDPYDLQGLDQTTHAEKVCASPACTWQVLSTRVASISETERSRSKSKCICRTQQPEGAARSSTVTVDNQAHKLPRYLVPYHSSLVSPEVPPTCQCTWGTSHIPHPLSFPLRLPFPQPADEGSRSPSPFFVVGHVRGAC